MKQTRVGTWHLHLDGTECSAKFTAWCEENEFERAHFNGHPDGYEHFEPIRHWTRKLDSKASFESAFAATCLAAGEKGFTGYVEGEFISRVITIPEAPFSQTTFPFLIQRRRLTSEEAFREGEFHLTFDANNSDKRVVNQLLNAGLYGAFELKDDGRRYLVLTMQGYMRDIAPLVRELESFLLRAGGLSRARLKVERAVAHKLFGITPAQLPPIADKIYWHQA